MKVIYGCGFVMIDDPNLLQSRADFWYCQSSISGRALLRARNNFINLIKIRKFRVDRTK